MTFILLLLCLFVAITINYCCFVVVVIIKLDLNQPIITIGLLKFVSIKFHYLFCQFPTKSISQGLAYINQMTLFLVLFFVLFEALTTAKVF